MTVQNDIISSNPHLIIIKET